MIFIPKQSLELTWAAFICLLPYQKAVNKALNRAFNKALS